MAAANELITLFILFSSPAQLASTATIKSAKRARKFRLAKLFGESVVVRFPPIFLGAIGSCRPVADVGPAVQRLVRPLL